MTKSIKQKIALAIAVVPMIVLTACSQSTDVSSTSEQFHGDEAFETSSNDSVIYDFSGPVTTTPGQSLKIELPETIRTKTPEGKKQPVESYTVTPRNIDSLKLCAADVKIKWVNDQAPENVWTAQTSKGESFNIHRIGRGLDIFKINEFNESSPEKGIFTSNDGREATVVNDCSEDLEDSFAYFNFTDPDQKQAGGYEDSYIFAGAKISVLTDGTMGADEGFYIKGYKQDSSGSWIES